MKKYFLIFFIFAYFFCPSKTLAQSILNINIGPSLDISRFSSYTITAEIAGYGSTNPVNIGISGINGDGISSWNFYANGTTYPDTLLYPMTHVSGNTWQKTNIYPDAIYPEIFFAPSSITWNNSPSSTTVRRNQYHLFHYDNPFTMANDMSFWIEFNAVASAGNSADMQVYLVKKNKNITFFNSNWLSLVGTTAVELVGTISRNASFHHTHNSNSSHHLIAISSNNDNTVGANRLDVSGDFWIVLYNTSPNVNRGWNLRYQTSVLCNNNSRWYEGNFTGWTTILKSGCPDAHIHIARRSPITDGVKAIVSAGSTFATQNFYYSPLPNLPPNATQITNPVGGAYSGDLTITWDPASDPNGGTLTYYLYLLDSGGTVVSTLSSGTTANSLVWDTTSVANSTYGIGGTVCDPLSLCAQFNSDLNFTVNNASPISSLSSINLASNNSDPTTAVTGDTVNLTFISSGSIPSPTAVFYANGELIQNSISIGYSGSNTWIASFIVDSLDSNGHITFTISSNSLDAEYFQTTDSSSVTINNPLPTNTPTSTPTSTPTPTNTPTPTPTNIPTNLFSTSSSSGNVSAPDCFDKKPFSSPDLFQIDVSGTEAKLFYTPVQGVVSGYYLAYGHETQKPIYGAVINQGESKGVLSFDVNHLKPNTDYFFQIRGQNGCMPGNWSNEMRVKTTLNDKKGMSFYKNFKAKLMSFFPRKITKVSEQVTLKPDNNGECKYIVEKGNSLWLIAQRIYKNGNYYQKIVEKNNLISTVIYPGQVLKVKCSD